MTIAITRRRKPYAAQAARLVANLILHNGRIYTPHGLVSTMAIRDGVIVRLGGDADIAALASDDARVIDLDGATVLPGLHDNHVHPHHAGLTAKRCVIPHGSPFEALGACVRASVAKAEPGEWIVGRAYETSTLGVRPTKKILDEIAPDNPVVLADVSNHSRWLNSVALAACDITRDTPDPDSGIIERDTDGEPTGILHETARQIVDARVPPPTRAQSLAAIKWAHDQMLSYGITAYMDAFVSGRQMLDIYAELADTGALMIRVVGCINHAAEDAIATRALYERKRFSPSSVKFQIDGVPTDSNTAVMLEPYVASSSGTESLGCGTLKIPQDEINRLVQTYDAMGLTVKIHATGDGAVRAALTAIAAARAVNGFSGLNHNVAHTSFAHPDDLEHGRRIGATFEFSPYILYDHPITRGVRLAVGDERMERWTPIREALDTGALCVPGSDWAVVSSVNPWAAIETMVTRQAPGGGEKEVGASQKITLDEAVDMFTIESARFHNRSHLTGSLEAGKFADFVVIERDIFDIPVTEIHATKVLRTFIEGLEVYTAV